MLQLVCLFNSSIPFRKKKIINENKINKRLQHPIQFWNGIEDIYTFQYQYQYQYYIYSMELDINQSTLFVFNINKSNLFR